MANKAHYTHLSTGEEVRTDFIDVGGSNFAPQVALAAGAAAIGTVTVAASESHLGAVGGHTALITSTIAMTTHANYASGDFVGTDATPLSFANAARVAGGSGVVVGAVLIDYAAQSIAGELWLFDASITPPADSAAWSISDADALKCIGVIPFGGTATPYYASALNSVCQSDSGLAAIPFDLAAGTTLYGAFVTRGAPTYASGDLSIRLRILQD